MILVEEADQLIMQQCRDFGTEIVVFEHSLGRVLAENLFADRDFPPFDRATMDGIAINIKAWNDGTRNYKIKSVQAAGDASVDTDHADECVEIMTGAAVSSTTDTVIPYEDIEISDGVATIITKNVSPHQNIHNRGSDKKQGELLVEALQVIDATILTIAATVGKTSLLVKKNPSVIIISTGNELVGLQELPSAFQVRRSNNYMLQAVLKDYRVHADIMHFPDDPNIVYEQLARCISNYDVVLLSGGISMGKFDHIPAVLAKLGVHQCFHKVRQKPGKPFWFGVHPKGTTLFAFPGNPVSTFMCCHRYFVPWLKTSWHMKPITIYARLEEDVEFKPSLQYFLQVALHIDNNAVLCATPIAGNGSGDFVNLLHGHAFMELPLEQTKFKKGDVFPIWRFKQIS